MLDSKRPATPIFAEIGGEISAVDAKISVSANLNSNFVRLNSNQSFAQFGRGKTKHFAFGVGDPNYFRWAGAKPNFCLL